MINSNTSNIKHQTSHPDTRDFAIAQHPTTIVTNEVYGRFLLQQ